jgi:hypothetical protein
LIKAGVVFTDEPEPGSILIPYFDAGGERLLEHYRVRLAKERADGSKYWQPPNPDPTETAYIGYFAPEPLQPGLDLYVVEGEFKALSLFEEGLAVTALPGLSCYAKDKATGEPRLISELRQALHRVKPARGFFIGDADTSHNFAFARSAHFLADALQ